MAEDKKKDEIAVIDITGEYLKERIYEIRGQRVILDADLSEIYGYSTKAFNQQVKNNIEKFDEDFMFQLSENEVGELSRSKILTLKQDDLNLKSKFLTSSLGSEYDSSKSKNSILQQEDYNLKSNFSTSSWGEKENFPTPSPNKVFTCL